MKNIHRHLTIIIKLCLLCTIIFSLVMLMTYSFSDKYVEDKVIESANTLKQEGPYYRLSKSIQTQVDNYTESYVLNMAVHREKQWHINAFLNPYYENEAIIDDPEIERINSVIDGIGKKANAYYGRYWQGHLSIIRPLLLFLNLKQIYIVFSIVMYLMIIYIIYLINKHIDFIYSLLFMLSLLFIRIWIVPLSSKFYFSFLVCFVISIIILNSKRDLDDKFYNLLFFISGATTVFLDYLSTPLVSFGIPCILLFMLNKENIDSLTTRKALNAYFRLLIYYLSGYLLLGLSNWLLYIIFSANSLQAINTIVIRVNNWTGNARFNELDINRLSSIKQALSVGIYKGEYYKDIYIFIELLFVLYFIFIKRNNMTMIMLLINAIPYIWWIIMSTSVFLHAWAVYRTIVISYLAKFSIIYYHIEKKKCSKLSCG